jgi:hypothetical protein
MNGKMSSNRTGHRRGHGKYNIKTDIVKYLYRPLTCGLDTHKMLSSHVSEAKI